MNPEIEVIERSNTDLYALVPLLEKRKANRILHEVEAYLSIIGHEGFSSSWAEIKEWDEMKEEQCWFTEFGFKFPEPKPTIKKTIQFILNQVLKEVETNVRRR